MIISHTFENTTLKFEVKDGILTCLDYGYGEVEIDATEQHRNIVQVHLCGENQNDHHFSKHTGASENLTLRYKNHFVTATPKGEKLAISQENDRIRVTTEFVFYRDVNGYSVTNKVENISKDDVILEYLSSLYIVGFGGNEWERDSRVFIPHNYWKAEASWREYSFPELGFYNVGCFTAKRISISNIGTMSTKEYLPMGMYQNTESGKMFLFQIESNASWQYEYATIGDGIYVSASGPSFAENGWAKKLTNGESFTSCPACVVFADNLDNVVGEITKYRRAIKKFPNLPFKVFFNDYMNCLDTHTSEDNDRPFVELAASVGCDCYMIDAGWYSEDTGCMVDEWYHKTGVWEESKDRYPNGLKNFLDFVRNRGLIPGLWMEIEVQSIEPEFAHTLPDSWFFVRNGKRVSDNYRYVLNFGNPEVVKFAKDAVDNVVTKYGAGFVKMDHNVNGGVGSDGFSYGEELRKHAEGYRQFIYDIKTKYPDVIFENCASGGCRMDYALLDLYDLQSTSDQTNYKKYAPISANIATACLPEQAGVWCYPMLNDKEETAFNMINSILHRVYLAGRLDKIDSECIELVKDAIKINKSIANAVQYGFPVFPIGLNKYNALYVCYGLKYKDDLYLAIWNLNNDEEINIDLSRYEVKDVDLYYPINLKTDFKFSNDCLTIKPHVQYFARLFNCKINKN